MSFKHCLGMLSLFLLGSPVLAQSTEPPKLEMRGWGLRVGLADDPDVVVGGVHFNLGEIAEHLRLQPSIELGIGDDHTTLFFTGALHYRFNVNTGFTPYAGGGLALGFIDRDRGRADDDTNFEIGLKATGGIEWQLSNAKAFFVELQLGIGDVHDTQVMAGWFF